MEYNRMLGEFICQRRKELGLTQKGLAEKVGVSDKAVSKWETLEANPDISLLIPLSEALQISVEELLKGKAAGIESSQAQAEHKTESTGSKPIKVGTYIVYILLSVLLGIIVAFLSVCVALAISSAKAEDRVTLIVFFSLALLAFAALFVFVIKKAVQNRVNVFAIPTEEKEINGYRIYQNLSKEEKRALRNERKKANCVFLGFYSFCAVGILVNHVLGYFYQSIAVAICGLVLCAGLIAVLITNMVLTDKWLRKNKIITTRRRYKQLKK